jgi:uncharacterized membrane protein YphA (DoxX/SURF4 family)
MKPAHKDLLLLVVRVALGITFAYSSLTKIPNMELFAEETANYRFLPALMVPLFAVCLTGVEILAGALLVAGIAVRAAVMVTGLMLVAFIIALSQALLRGIDLSCGCFGGAELASWWTVARDVVMLGACAVLLKWGSGRWLFWRPARSG